MISYLLTYNKYFSTVQETKEKLNYPLSLTEVKRHLRMDMTYNDDDDYLEGLIETATTMAENYIEKNIALTLVSIRIDDFSDNWIRINDGNFISIEDVLDIDGNPIGTVKQTNKHDDFFQIEWEQLISTKQLTIKYLAGYPENETPAIIKQAILIKIADLYDSQRADMNWSGLVDNKVFETILNYYKTTRF